MSEINIEESYTKLVRPLTEKEYDELRNSIRSNGLLVPITISQNGIIVDGHNRYKICQELGIKPVVIRREFPSAAAEKLFVIESNLKRRHLTDIEKVELGMKLEPIEVELASERHGGDHKSDEYQKSSGSNEHLDQAKDDLSPKSTSGEPDIGRARDHIAKKVGLSPTTYHRGKTVLEKGSDKIKQELKAGETSISAAYNQVKGKDKKPKQAVESSDILMLPEDKYQATIAAINEAIAAHDKQVVFRHDKHKVISVGKELEISTV